MLKSIIKACAGVLSALGIATALAHEAPLAEPALALKQGDVIVQHGEGGWRAIKVLALDPWPGGTFTAHCLSYESVADKPTLESLRSARVRAWHAPIAAESFRHGWERIGNVPPAKEELVGFIDYLKLTDFPRYAAFTGQKVDEIVRQANQHYQRANALGEQGRRTEAIAEYGVAIELFPLFYEAIDNRAFTYMELGRVREALADFDESLRVNPDGVSAFFSKGECLLKLGDLQAAERIFQEGVRRFPEQRDLFAKFLAQARALQEKG
jgi:tetratricopeptide (TPR) repeat protein